MTSAGILEELLHELRRLNRAVETLNAHELSRERSATPDVRVWFDVGQAGEYAGCDPQTLAKACRTGTSRAGQPFGGAGGRWRIHRDDLDSWLRGATP